MNSFYLLDYEIYSSDLFSLFGFEYLNLWNKNKFFCWKCRIQRKYIKNAFFTLQITQHILIVLKRLQKFKYVILLFFLNFWLSILHSSAHVQLRLKLEMEDTNQTQSSNRNFIWCNLLVVFQYMRKIFWSASFGESFFLGD